jgi:hypothetical protein
MYILHWGTQALYTQQILLGVLDITNFTIRPREHYQSVRYVKLCHAVGVVAVGKLDKVYQSLRVHLFLRHVLTIV